MAERNVNEDIKPSKKQSASKIDGIVTGVMALCAGMTAFNTAADAAWSQLYFCCFKWHCVAFGIRYYLAILLFIGFVAGIAYGGLVFMLKRAARNRTFDVTLWQMLKMQESPIPQAY